jgi:O-antigen/teichoic acid export membrane protein
MIIGLYFVTINHAGFIPIVAVVSASSLLYTLFLWSKCPEIRLGIDKEISRVLFKRMWPTALAIIFNAFYLQGDRVILPWFVNSEQVGLYGSAYRVIDIVTQTVAMIMGIMAPFLSYHWSRQLREKFNYYYQLSFDLTALFLFPAIAGISALSTPIMRFIDPKYTAAGPILVILIWTVAGIWLGMTFGYIILTLKKQRQALLVYLSNAIISVIGYFIFIPRFGIWGAVGVSIFSELYAGLFLLILCTYHTRIIPHITTFFKIILASAIMGAGVFYLKNHLPIAILSGIIIYAGLVVILKVISPDSIKQLFGKKAGQIIE